MNKRQNFQGLPELPEEPNGEAENTGSSGDAKRNQNKLVADVIHQGDLKSNNDAYTLKTTQQSSKQGINTDTEGIINI